MVDYQSRYRLYGLGYTKPTPRKAVPSFSDLYKSSAPYLFKSGQTPTHDCRLEVLKDHADRKDWETQLLCHGLRKTCADINDLHTPKLNEDKTRRGKLLFHLGTKGSAEGDFCYPRGLVVTGKGDIIIADTMNHRVQVLNQCGVFKFAIGQKGESDGQFNQPTGVTVMSNDDIVVGDNKNKRIQVFNHHGEFKTSFQTTKTPYSVTCDQDDNIIVGTASKSVELYTKDGKLQRQFKIKPARPKGISPVQVCCNIHGEIVVLDPEQQRIQSYSRTGRLLRSVTLELNEDGLSIIPTFICSSLDGHIIVCDSLNHTISRYSEKGELHQQIFGPTDNVGPVQTCGLGPEGHLVVTEFSVTGDHCVKIFRYSDCVCHLCRPGSSKRRALTKSPTKEILISSPSISSSKNE